MLIVVELNIATAIAALVRSRTARRHYLFFSSNEIPHPPSENVFLISSQKSPEYTSTKLDLPQVGGHCKQWGKIDGLKQTLSDYNHSAENIVKFSQQVMFANKVRATEFIEQLTDKYLMETSDLNETECYQTLFNLTSMQRSFQSEIHRSQVPLENVLTELTGIFDGISNAINLSQDLADTKYSICKASNENDICEKETDLWLEGVISSIRCQITNCSNHRSKRSANNNCLLGSFVCGSGECISPNSVCDSKSDCSDGTDEIGCCPPYNYQNRILCGSSCIQNYKVCDGREDCGDGFDERHCGVMKNACSIEYGLHKCDFKKCIGLDQVCDGHQDCNDGSDEGDECGVGLCPEACTKRGGVCFHGPLGPLCFDQCPMGTFETPEGCTASSRPTNRTVEQLLDDIQKLSYSQSKKFAYLKMKAIGRVSKMMSDVFKCLDPNYTAFAKVVSFRINNQTADESHLGDSEVTTPKPN